eukprot:c38248_g1_i1 orf=273-1079(+)
MARIVGIQSAPSSAIAFNPTFERQFPPHTCSPQLPFPSHHLIWKASCSQDFRSRRKLCKLSYSLSCSRHGLGVFERCLITHTRASAAQCSSHSSSCLSRNLDHIMCTCTPKRSVMVTASATGDSDQSSSSHEEDGEGIVGCCKEEDKAPPKKPSPEIEPTDVVQAQLQALRDRDFITVFEFASPKNKAHTGPLSRFTEMIQGRAYNVMLGHTSAEVLSTLLVGPERFQQRVLITGTNGKQAIFSWSLSRQETDPFQDCWMTDSVHRDE